MAPWELRYRDLVIAFGKSAAVAGISREDDPGACE
jgi:hypothetical protein